MGVVLPFREIIYGSQHYTPLGKLAWELVTGEEAKELVLCSTFVTVHRPLQCLQVLIALHYYCGIHCHLQILVVIHRSFISSSIARLIIPISRECP